MKKINVRVTALHCYDTSIELLHNSDLEKLGFGNCSYNMMLQYLHEHYTEEQEKEYGVMGIEFEFDKYYTNRISGSACFVVSDLSLLNAYDAEFIYWLKNNGFISWGEGHCFGVNWVYVNIETKVYAFGMPGIPITKVVYNHAVTIDEFMTIYGIFSKYKGTTLLNMNGNK